jgi:D-alanyl-D-alanine carboxypeptidase
MEKTRTKSKTNRKTLVTAFVLFFFTTSFAQENAKLDQFFDRLNEKNKAMGSIEISTEGKVLYTRSIGFTNINATEKKPLTATTRYRIGSITKMFTAQ